MSKEKHTFTREVQLAINDWWPAQQMKKISQSHVKVFEHNMKRLQEAMIRAHMPNMDREDFVRAEATLSCLGAGQDWLMARAQVERKHDARSLA